MIYRALNHSADSSVGEGEELLIQDSKMNDSSEEEKTSTSKEVITRLRRVIPNCNTSSTVQHNPENTADSHADQCTPSREDSNREDKESQQRASQTTKLRESQTRAGHTIMIK